VVTGTPQLTEHDVSGGVIPRFHTMVRTRAHQAAAADDRRRVSYAGLARQAALIRAAIRATPGNGPVGLLHEHDSGAVGAVLGILGSGRPLVVLDPRSPAPHLRRLLARARAGVCVTDAGHADQAAAAAAHTIVMDRLVPAADTLDQFWSAPPDPASPALLAYTSGTTGRPKIVVNSHRMLVRDAWANAVTTDCYGPDDVVAQTLPMSFHAGLMATVAGILVGVTLRFHDPRTAPVDELAGWLQAAGATVAHLTPAAARALAAARPDPTLLAGLRAVTIAGEPFYGPDAQALRALLPDACVIHHRYGSSETGLVCSQPLRCGDPLPQGAVPVGRPVAGRRVDVVGEDGRPVRAGEPGIVVVTGRDLGSGYWDDPAATGTTFEEHPDGTRTCRTNDLGHLDALGRLTLLGRSDLSVKIGEYLVEPGEVDAALFELPGVREAVTVGTRRADGTSHLVAYVVPADATTSTDQVRAGLASLLPPYMVPDTVVLLEALPRTDRGKIDRAALPITPLTPT
jgi:acyl-coenzyme A synthetase/AMP-(fatty) acid ligase